MQVVNGKTLLTFLFPFYLLTPTKNIKLVKSQQHIFIWIIDKIFVRFRCIRA